MSELPESIEERLRSIGDQVRRGLVPPAETVRSFLGWFGASRRSPRRIRTMKETLERHGLLTDPDLDVAYIDDPIRFLPTGDGAAGPPTAPARVDPTFRVGRLDQAHRPLVFVTPNDSLEKAVTMLLSHDFSQLPAMNGTREVKGVVTWKTIGSRLALGKSCLCVSDCMEPPCIVDADDSLFDAVSAIASSDYVLVRAADKTIAGILTATDFNGQFRSLAEPFLLVGEIENGLRQMLHGKFSAAELAAAKGTSGDASRSITSVNDLTFGEYQRLLEAPPHWARLRIQIDREHFISRLGRIREIRNDVMHFEPDGLDEEDLEVLREFAQFLKVLRDVADS